MYALADTSRGYGREVLGHPEHNTVAECVLGKV
jgi:hypothetical protein